jgi:phage terminase large subunit GpA-like protein
LTVTDNATGFIMDRAPGPMIIVFPTVEMAERHSDSRIKPLIRRWSLNPFRKA